MGPRQVQVQEQEQEQQSKTGLCNPVEIGQYKKILWELQIANFKLLIKTQLVAKSCNVDCLNTAFWMLLTEICAIWCNILYFW
jgi:hypothetical protein